MKSLVKYIKESIEKHSKDMYSCNTIGGRAATFQKKDLIDCLENLHNYKKLENIMVTAYDAKRPRTLSYKYEGKEDDTLVFVAQSDDEFTNKNLYDTLMNDLETMNDVIKVKFDKCKYVQSLSAYQDDFYSKDSYILAFEG